MMKEHRLHYLPIRNDKEIKNIRLRHLKYIRAINNSTDMSHKKIGNNFTMSNKSHYSCLKAVDKVEISNSQVKSTSQLYYLYHIAKTLKKVSLIHIYDPMYVSCEGNTQQSRLLARARYLKSLEFSYEIQDPNFSGYEIFYDKVLGLNGSPAVKQKSLVISDNISSNFQNLNVLLPKDIEIIVDFRVSNEILDYPPVNRYSHENNNHIWNLAASYSTEYEVGNPHAHMLESLFKIRKIFLSCEASNNSFDNFTKFLSKVSHIDTMHIQLKKGIYEQIIYFKDLIAILKSDLKWVNNLKNLIIDCEDINFDPIELSHINFPKGLTSLQLNLKHAKINSAENFHIIENFPTSLQSLCNLRSLKIAFPTAFLMNRVFHNLPSTFHNMETLHFEFIDNTKIVGDEEIYLNSLLECICTMPLLKEFRIKAGKLNYTYCAYLSHENMPSNIKILQWIDTTLRPDTKNGKDIKTTQWIECKKFEDLNIILRLLTEEIEYLEIPFVFDGLESEFVALRFIEILPLLKNLRNLKLAFGFKTLDESNVESILNFISKVNDASSSKMSFQMDLNVYYRKIKGSFNVDEITYQNNSVFPKKCYLQFIQDLFS